MFSVERIQACRWWFLFVYILQALIHWYVGRARDILKLPLDFRIKRVKMLPIKEQVVPIEEVTKSLGCDSVINRSKVKAESMKWNRPLDFKNLFTSNAKTAATHPLASKQQNTGFSFTKIGCDPMTSNSNHPASTGSSPTHQVIRVRMLLPDDPVFLGQENIPTYRIVQQNSDSPAKVVKTRKFGFLTQRRKDIAEKYIHEILPKASNTDFGEYGSLKWCNLLLDRYHALRDFLVTVDCIKHWINGTPWGRKICKAYEAGVKAKYSALAEYERVKSDLFSSKRKKLTEPPREPDPAAVDGFLNDHDYCKNTWLEDALKEICSSNATHASAVDDLVNFLVNDNSRSSAFGDLLNDAGL